MHGATVTNESTHGGKSSKKTGKKKKEVFDGITTAEARLEKMAQRADGRLERVTRAMNKNERLAARADRKASHIRLDVKSGGSSGDGSDSYFDHGRFGHQTLDHTFNNDSDEESGSYMSPERRATT